jgi:HSP20 family protein
MSDIQKPVTESNGARMTSPSVDPAPLWRTSPDLDFYESPNEYLVRLDVPGASLESVDVQVTGTELRVRAEQAASVGYTDVARVVFERRLELPTEVDATNASAQLRDGVLDIRLQKNAAARKVKIVVNPN